MTKFDELPTLNVGEDNPNNDPLPEANNAGAASVNWDAAVTRALAASYGHLENLDNTHPAVGSVYNLVEIAYDTSDLPYLKWAAAFTHIDLAGTDLSGEDPAMRISIGMPADPVLHGFPTPSGPRVTRVAGMGFKPYLTISVMNMAESEDPTRRGEMECSGLYGDVVGALYREVMVREGLGENPELAEAPPAIEQITALLNALFRSGFSVPETDVHPDNYDRLWSADGNDGVFMMLHSSQRSAVEIRFDYVTLKQLDASMKAASRKFIDTLYDEDSSTTVIL